MALPKPEYKPPPVRITRFVEVPRALTPQYWVLPWAEVVTAAQEGRDGLRMVEDNFFAFGNQTPETAWLRRAPSGGCLLFRQHWCDDTNDRRWRKDRY
jgi:hypothetical protein